MGIAAERYRLLRTHAWSDDVLQRVLRGAGGGGRSALPGSRPALACAPPCPHDRSPPLQTPVPRRARRYAPRMAPEQRREQLDRRRPERDHRAGLRRRLDRGDRATAGVTRPVVYDHFPNLGRLLHALVEREEHYALEQLARVVPDDPGDGDPVEVLAASVRRFLDAVVARPATWRIILLPLEGTPAIVREHVRDQPRADPRADRAARPMGGQRRRAAPRARRRAGARAIRDLGEEAGRMVLTDPERYSPDRYERFVADRGEAAVACVSGGRDERADRALGVELAAAIRRREVTATRGRGGAHRAPSARARRAINALVAERFEQARAGGGAAADARIAVPRADDGAAAAAGRAVHGQGVDRARAECRSRPDLSRGGTIAPDETAPPVQRLIDAGAIPLGVTNTSELTLWIESANRLYGRDQQPIRRRPDRRRIVGRRGRGRGLRRLAVRDRLRHRRLDPRARALLRRVRAQAIARPGAQHRPLPADARGEADADARHRSARATRRGPDAAAADHGRPRRPGRR